MDLKQFEIEVLLLKDKIARLAFYLLGNNEEAEDATQEVFLKLWHIKDELEVVDNMQAFALRITRNLCLDKIRAQNRRLQKNEAIEESLKERADNPHEQTEIRDLLSVIKKQIAALPETQRTVITLRDIEGLEFDEIAEITGMNENAIKVNLSRARKKIRSLFTEK